MIYSNVVLWIKCICVHIYFDMLFTFCYIYILCVENENTYWLALLRLLNNYFFILLPATALENLDNSYKVCTQSHLWYVHTITQLTQRMCEEYKSTEWSKNWPYLWLMACEISSGIFSNMPTYRPLYSAFVVIMLATLVDDKTNKQTKQNKSGPSWPSTERIDSVTEHTCTHLLILFTFLNVPTW